MNQTEIERMLIAVVCELQQLSGREIVTVSSKTRPVLDMPGFDSLNGVEATVGALDRLNLDLDFNNVFVENDKALTIQQAAARLHACIQQQT